MGWPHRDHRLTTPCGCITFPRPVSYPSRQAGTCESSAEELYGRIKQRMRVTEVKNAINSKGGIRRGTILGRLSNVDDFRLVGNRQASSQIAKGAGKSLALFRREV